MRTLSSRAHTHTHTKNRFGSITKTPLSLSCIHSKTYYVIEMVLIRRKRSHTQPVSTYECGILKFVLCFFTPPFSFVLLFFFAALSVILCRCSVSHDTPPPHTQGFSDCENCWQKCSTFAKFQRSRYHVRVRRGDWRQKINRNHQYNS